MRRAHVPNSQVSFNKWSNLSPITSIPNKINKLLLFSWRSEDWRATSLAHINFTAHRTFMWIVKWFFVSWPFEPNWWQTIAQMYFEVAFALFHRWQFVMNIYKFYYSCHAWVVSQAHTMARCRRFNWENEFKRFLIINKCSLLLLLQFC